MNFMVLTMENLVLVFRGQTLFLGLFFVSLVKHPANVTIGFAVILELLN